MDGDRKAVSGDIAGQVLSHDGKPCQPDARTAAQKKSSWVSARRDHAIDVLR
jgi:hypothetical protein